jgi:hypothetical protein
MSQVNDFSTFALHNAAHDVNGSVVAIKKGGGRYYTNFIGRGVIHNKIKNTLKDAWQK